MYIVIVMMTQMHATFSSFYLLMWCCGMSVRCTSDLCVLFCFSFDLGLPLEHNTQHWIFWMEAAWKWWWSAVMPFCARRPEPHRYWYLRSYVEMGDQTAFTERLLFSVIHDASRLTFRIVVRVATGYQMLHGYPPHKYSDIGGGVGPSNFVSPLRGRRRGFCVDVTVWRCRGDEWLIIIFIHYHYHHIRFSTLW